MMVLDVGGGTWGSGLPEVYDGCEHYVLDLAPGGNPKCKFIESDARELVYIDSLHNQFDAVYCSHTLEHFDPGDVPTVVAGIRAALRPQGWCEIRVPDLQAISRYIADGASPDSPLYIVGDGTVVRLRDLIYGHPRDIKISDLMRHRHGFTPATLTSLLSCFFDKIGHGLHAGSCELRVIGMCSERSPFPYGTL